VYADDAVDMTDEVLKVFNTTVAMPAAKPADGASTPKPGTAPAPKAAAPAPAPTKKP
jgi:hypothetical protein